MECELFYGARSHSPATGSAGLSGDISLRPNSSVHLHDTLSSLQTLDLPFGPSNPFQRCSASSIQPG